MQQSTVWSVSPSLPRQKLDPQQPLTFVLPGGIHTYIYIFTEPLTTKVGLNVEFIMKRAKLQYASRTHLNDGEQYLSGAFSHWCKTGLPDSWSTPTKTHTFMRSLPQFHFSQLQQLSSISTNLPSSLPQKKKNYREELKMKSNIAPWYNGDQSVTIWWSTQSYVRHWRVRECRPSVNKST
jgi:hypothetical protein